MSVATNREIWLTVDSSGFGGIESHILALADALRAAGCLPRVLFLRDHGPHPLKDKLSASGLPHSICNGLSGLFREISAARPALLHSHGYKANILTRIAAVTTSTPVVASFHAGEAVRGKLKFYTELDRITGAPLQKIAVSQMIAHRLTGPKTQIDNFVAAANDTAPLKGGRVLFIGRLSEEKGPDLFCQIAARFPDADFYCLGDGPMRDALQARHRGHVSFFGAVPNVSQYLTAADLVLMPSRHEGLPMAALEAMALGVPVAAFTVGGLPELIEDGRNGYCAPAGDLDLLSEKVNHYLKLTVAARAEIGSSAQRTIAERFSPDVILPKIFSVYAAAEGRKGSFYDLALA